MKKTALFCACLLLLSAPVFEARAAASKFTYAGWIPYWTVSTGIPDTLANLKKLGEISPFAYEVQPDGSLKDRLKMNTAPWPPLLLAARSNKIKVIPTISWTDGASIYATLSSSTARSAHEAQILSLVATSGWDGVDIDYEDKTAETEPYFSKFVTELGTALHARKKLLTCAIEARTPVSSRFETPPPDIEYANDYAILSKYCDEFRILAYDQRNVDIVLNKAKGANDLYAPVADPAWVKKVIQEALKSVPASKIMLGIPTYGEDDAVAAGGSYSYDPTASLSYADALKLATSVHMKPQRNSAGELSFSYYVAATSTASGARAGTTHVVSMSDATAVAQKIALAKQFGLKGVVLFRIDGKSDPLIWSKLK